MGIFENLNLDIMEHEDLVILRHNREQVISEAIHDINLIHIEINRRGGKVELPEFGSPMTSLGQLSLSEGNTEFDHDTFLDGIPPNDAA